MRNFGGTGLQTASSLYCPSSAKSGKAWTSLSVDHARYKGFIGDLAEKFEADGQDRKLLSTNTVYHYLTYGYDPDVGIGCARTKQKNIQWLPPTYATYKTVWDYYGDLRDVVQHFYDGGGAIATASVTMVPTTVEEPAQQETEITSSRQYASRIQQQRRQRQRQRQGAQAQSSPQVSSPASPQIMAQQGVFTPPGSPRVSTTDIESARTTTQTLEPQETEGMSTALKVAIGLGIVGAGLYLARRRGMI